MQKIIEKPNKNSNTEHETLFLEGKNKDPNIIEKTNLPITSKVDKLQNEMINKKKNFHANFGPYMQGQYNISQ